MSKSSDESCCCRIELVFAALILRLWVGMRLFFAGLAKFEGAEGGYALGNLKGNMDKIAQGMIADTPIPHFMVKGFTFVLPWALLVIGALILVGFARKISLFAGGLLLLGLGFGLMLLPDDIEAVRIGVSVIVTAFALFLSQHDKISVDGILGLASGGEKKKDA